MKLYTKNDLPKNWWNTKIFFEYEIPLQCAWNTIKLTTSQAKLVVLILQKNLPDILSHRVMNNTKYFKKIVTQTRTTPFSVAILNLYLGKFPSHLYKAKRVTRATFAILCFAPLQFSISPRPTVLYMTSFRPCILWLVKICLASYIYNTLRR